jgi:phosphoserine phosphatase RsbU/P
VTALYAVLDLARRGLSLSTAGHPSPLLWRAGEQSTRPMLSEGVFPLVIMDYERIPLGLEKLSGGDRVLFYTDGVLEQFDTHDGMYGVERLALALARSAALAPQAAVDAMVADLRAFAAGHEPQDDQTLLLLTVS